MINPRNLGKIFRNVWKYANSSIIFEFMKEQKAAIPHVTDEEKSWVKALAEGKPSNEVAANFNMKDGTFAYKLSILRGRFNCENTNGLIAYFLRNKLID